jgi:hypothetical protein
MTTDLPPVPPAVMEFAEQHGYKIVKPNSFWKGTTPYNNYKGYTVYDIKDENVYFCFILFKDQQARMATDDEINEITDIYF